LRRIGLLTIHFTWIEELLALFCELLLLRPELGGFRISKPLLTKYFSEKLNLYRSLTAAVGTLYSLNTNSLEKSIDATDELGDARNTVIRGLLQLGGVDADLVFRNRGREGPATRDGIRSLAARCQSAHSELTLQFLTFYAELTRVKPVNAQLEILALAVVKSRADLFGSVNRVRQGKSKVRQLQADLSAAKLKQIESHTKLRNVRVRLRRLEKTRGFYLPKGARRETGAVGPTPIAEHKGGFVVVNLFGEKALLCLPFTEGGEARLRSEP
jgi:hypothetical protein